jgi:hypothetical protein
MATSRTPRSCLRYVVEREPGNTQAMANLVRVLADAGKTEDRSDWRRRSPSSSRSRRSPYFNRGMAAMRAGDLHAAKRRSSARSRARRTTTSSISGSRSRTSGSARREARKHLAIAVQNSTTRSDHDIYAAKLDR